MSHPLYVAFVWHLHQPYYRDEETGEYTQPWVRLHAVKDYLHLAQVLADYPAIHQTFNLVPCLVEQLYDYAHNQAMDRAQRLSRTPATRLTVQEKAHLLSFFFSISWEKVVRRQPHYWRLLRLKEEVGDQPRLLSTAYYRDLVAWFNLAWIDPATRERDRELKALADKGSGYSHRDIERILHKHQEMMAEIIPLYRSLQARGQMEISTSPYFHPILPLLIDNGSAREASPGLELANPGFVHPEDAAEQVRLAVEAHRRYFGEPPRGLWPSEGAVSQELVDLVASRTDFAWLASDEGVLARSLGIAIERDGQERALNPQALYQPYRLEPAWPRRSGPGLQIMFRDHQLSDLIGFVYKHWDERAAAEDLVARLRGIHDCLAGDDAPHLVTIILDGENCWEEYDHNGDRFLRHLYELISGDSSLHTTTLSEYLARFPAKDALPRLAAGSWIGANLETWIGEPAQNRAWEYLKRAKTRLTEWQAAYPLADLPVLERALRELYIAEGSDWFWWYYSRNSSENELLFDQAFREHLNRVYRIMGIPSPSWLKEPISSAVAATPTRPMGGYISPRLSAAEVASEQWLTAGCVEPLSSTGAMQRARTVMKRLYYGYDPADLYLRLESTGKIGPFFVGFYLSLPGAKPANRSTRYGGTNLEIESPESPLTWEIAVFPGASYAVLNRSDGHGGWVPVREMGSVALGPRNLELSLPLADLGLKLGDTLDLVVNLARDMVLLEALPSRNALTVQLVPRG